MLFHHRRLVVVSLSSYCFCQRVGGSFVFGKFVSGSEDPFVVVVVAAAAADCELHAAADDCELPADES